MDNYFDLGEYSRKISTNSEKAQLWFDRGLNWCYCFNHEEGVACFHKALEHDPNCAMAHWGIAFGSGPFYNLPWRDFGKVELAKYAKICHDHARIAKSMSAVSEVEADIITALTFRFSFDGVVPVDKLDKSDTDYANAMREVYKKHPQDLDVMALFAEAMMTRTPWKLWDINTCKPAEDSDIVEIMGVLDKAIAICDERAIARHPAIAHLHIHAIEMSPAPEDAMGSADILCTLCPNGGHISHMPSHIYVLCGMYEEAKTASERAIRADRLYLDYAGPYNFYTTARCHNLCMMMHTCMFLGQFEPAFAAANETCETLSRDVLEVQDRPQLATIMEAYYSMAVHVLVRFGKWQEIIESPMPECPLLYVVSTPMHHYAKGISYATLGRFDDADREREKFYESVQRIPKERKFFKNFGTNVLAVAEKMLEGEVEYHKGNHEVGYEHSAGKCAQKRQSYL